MLRTSYTGQSSLCKYWECSAYQCSFEIDVRRKLGRLNNGGKYTILDIIIGKSKWVVNRTWPNLTMLLQGSRTWKSDQRLLNMETTHMPVLY